MISGVIRNLILPVVLSIEFYGYWQTYLLYLSFLGILSFGFNDGIALSYSKYNIEELPSKKIRSSAFIYGLLNAIISILLLFIVIFHEESNKAFILSALILNIPLVSITGLLNTLLQTTNKIKLYSLFVSIDKFLLMILILLLWWLNLVTYQLIIIFDIGIRIIMLFAQVFLFRNIIFGKLYNLKFSLSFFVEYLSVGYKLLIANLTSMLILNIGRVLAQVFLSIQLFATYSFALNLINLLMIAITSVSTVVFPHFARKNIIENRTSFIKLNNILHLLFPFIVFTYYPFYFLVKFYYIEYFSIFEFFIYSLLIVPISSKMSILNNTYYKILRLEKRMMFENIISIVIFTLTSFFFIKLYPSLIAIALSTLIAITYRCYASQIFISRKLQIKVPYNLIVSEISLILLIIISFEVLSVKESLISFIVILPLWLKLTRGKLVKNFY